jgi:hypothetical protein
MDWPSALHAIQDLLKKFSVDEIVQALVDEQGKERIQEAQERSR